MHKVHEIFAANIIAASHARTLESASREWALERIGHAAGSKVRCNVCNTSLHQFWVLRNTQNGNILMVGGECYDKLIAYLVTGRVESQLPDRRRTVRSRKGEWAAVGETVVRWLNDRLAAGEIDDSEIVEILKAAGELGFAPREGDADRVVAYYKATRKFPVTALLAPEVRQDLPEGIEVPPELTIDQADQLMKLVANSRIQSQTARIDARLNQEKEAVVRLLEHAPYNASFLQSQAEASFGHQKLIKWTSAKESEVLLVPNPRPERIDDEPVPYALFKGKDGWFRVEVRIWGVVPSSPGFFRILHQSTANEGTVVLVAEEIKTPLLRVVNFAIPRQRWGFVEYVGKSADGRFVVVDPDVVTKPGKYLCFVVREDDGERHVVLLDEKRQ